MRIRAVPPVDFNRISSRGDREFVWEWIGLIIIKSSHLTSKENYMQAPNIFYQTYYPFYNLPQYTTLLPEFWPSFNYFSPYHKCQTADLVPIKIISSATECTQSPQLEPKPTPSAKPNSKKIKKKASKAKQIKKELQFFSNEIDKLQQPQLIEQKDGRNANSNLLRMFFRRLKNKIENNPHQIQNAISKYQMKIRLQEFIQWININKVDYRNYIRILSVRKYFEDQQFVRELTKIMRILLKDFVYNEAIPCYLTSKKVRKEVMVHNYHALRIILNEILNFNR